MFRVTCLFLLAVSACLWLSLPAAAEGEVVVDLPELTIIRTGLNETCFMPAPEYTDFRVEGETASFILVGRAFDEGHKRVFGKGIRRVSWEPTGEGDTLVRMEFVSEPESTLINAIPYSKSRPATPQAVAGFTFSTDGEEKNYPVLGTYNDRRPDDADRHGNYELPKLADVKYSDALVTLDVNGVDFRDVLWFMSEIGNISIILDPYWADEPTGSRRPPGAGADPGAGSGGGGGQPGFRPTGSFVPGVIREGTGNLSLHFNNVPFDQALELVVMAAGLEIVDIMPE